MAVLRVRGVALPDGEPDSALVTAGVAPHAAIAAASWTARSYLGLPGLADGAPADAVVFDADPRTDLGQLDKPRAVIVRGKPVRG
jgi:imidazolonepropionase-like amidohydrolase